MIKAYALMLTGDPYEPRETHSVYSSKELADKAMDIYLNNYTKGDQVYRASLVKDDPQFGPDVFVNEIVILDEIDLNVLKCED